MGYGKADAGKDSDSSVRKVSGAWHDAKTDSGARGGKDAGYFKSAPAWAERHTKSGISFFPKRAEKSSKGK